MKKPAGNRNSTKDKFTVTEVGALIEELRSNFKLFGEKQEDISKKLDANQEQVANNTERLTLLEISIRNMTAKIDALTKSIDKLIQTKADREELISLEHRVSALEAKVASFSQ